MTDRHDRPQTGPLQPIARPVKPRKSIWSRLTSQSGSTLAKNVGAVLLALIPIAIFIITVVFILLAQLKDKDDPKDNHPGVTGLAATPLAGIGVLTWDASRRYVFPIAADPAYYTWTHANRSVPNSVALEARLGLTLAEYQEVTRAPVVAVTTGIVRAFNDGVNGLGYVLQGDDGLDYYYAHLSQQAIPDGARVSIGQTLGSLGTTGGAARFLERQVRFAVGMRGEPLANAPTTNAAEWLYSAFGLRWAERSTIQAPESWPHGWPILNPNAVIETYYDQARARGLPEMAIEFAFIGEPPTTPQDVYATLDGTANVIRWTDLYGTRIQITNEAALFTVIISGLDSWTVTDGQIVSKGQIIGQWTPSLRPRLHYMIFQNGVNIDPESTLR